MEKRYRVVLSLAEREELQLLVSRGKSAARKQTRARILLMWRRVRGGAAHGHGGGRGAVGGEGDG